MKEINVALLGLGNVGLAFARFIERASDEIKIHIRAAADSTGGLILDAPAQSSSTAKHAMDLLLAHKESGRSIKEFSPDDSITDPREFIKSLPCAGVSLLVESLPTNLCDGRPALDLLLAALSQGTDVVTVDKGPLACGFEKIMEAAQAAGARIAYTGTTGVKVPDEVRGERVLEIRGILNGTTNYILTEMQTGSLSFEEALARAEAEGIAEPDPSLDIAGWDTAAKILILAKTLMGADACLEEVSRIGIGPETRSLIETGRESDRIVRLAGRARIWQGRVRVSVAPKLLNSDSPFYEVSGTSKAAVFRTEGRGEVWTFSRSGRDAISQTILDDIISMMGETF
ncbi:MAG: hypothetical protein L0229_22630 [Blastocatellia bacterium]|nr:hypothetical protein [Blastocatellia bacterium]